MLEPDWPARNQVESLGGVQEIDDYSDYRRVNTPSELQGDGDRVFELPAPPVRTVPRPVVLFGEPKLPLHNWVRRDSAKLRVAKIDDALVFPDKNIVNLRNGRAALDSIRKLFYETSSNSMTAIDKRRMHFARIDGLLNDPNTPTISDAFSGFARHAGFGHLLLEAISQLWPVSDDFVAKDGRTVLVNPLRRDYHLAYFDAVGIARDRLSALHRPTRVKRLFLASQSFVVQRAVSNGFFDLMQRIAAYHTDTSAPPYRRLYISRRGATKRRMLNEERIEAAFQRHGFEIVHPERLSVPKQISAFAAAEWIAGSVGSGLYNAAFSSPKLRRIILAPSYFFTPNDLLLSRKHGPMYMFDNRGTSNPKHAISEDWSIDERAVDRSLRKIFGVPAKLMRGL